MSRNFCEVIKVTPGFATKVREVNRKGLPCLCRKEGERKIVIAKVVVEPSAELREEQ